MASFFNETIDKLSQLKLKISLNEVEELDVCSKFILTSHLANLDSIDNQSVIKIQALIDYMYEQVNIGNWKDVKPFLRKTITIASYLKLISNIICFKNSECTLEHAEDHESTLKESFKIIDFGILFGCPLDSNPRLLQTCANILNSLQSTLPSVENLNYTCKELDTSEPVKSHNALLIETISCPSMEYFYQNYIMAEVPIVLNDCIDHWPALEKWKNENYFLKLAGLRTVSIELGSNYTDSDWTQKLMTVEEFIKQHLFKSDGPKGYLAQYQLFEHIPELKEDITEPEYCYFSDNDEPVEVMAWYGPKGTISPLHHDPKRNLLAQVVGQKQIYLFSPKDTCYLYPHQHELLNNTSQVDPRAPDLEKYPELKNAKAFFCVLSPGQMLYIPPKWWHFVESLSISFSVSFWWN